jgi:hypothetical protein
MPAPGHSQEAYGDGDTGPPRQGHRMILRCSSDGDAGRERSRPYRIGFQGAETLLTECDLGEAAGRFIDGGQNNRIPDDLTRVAAAARACRRTGDGYPASSHGG